MNDDKLIRLKRILKGLEYEPLFIPKDENMSHTNMVVDQLEGMLGAGDLLVGNKELSYHVRHRELRIKKKINEKFDVIEEVIRESVTGDMIQPLRTIIKMHSSHVPSFFDPSPQRCFLNLEKVGKKHNLSLTEEKLILSLLNVANNLEDEDSALNQLKQYLEVDGE